MFFRNSQSVLLAFAALLVIISIQNPAFAVNENEKLFPNWVRQSIAIWVDDGISDLEFLSLIENVLSSNILPEEIETTEDIKFAARGIYEDIPKDEQEEYEIIPSWVKDRAEWWIDGKISDAQFLRTIHYLREVGYLEYNPEKSIFTNEDTFNSSLEKFLLTEKEIKEITEKTIWRYISTEYEFEEKDGVIDSVRIMLKDITRVYEPMYYKFKVPSMTMQISEFNSQTDLENYWGFFEDKTKQSIFESAYMTGTPNQFSECFFNYTSEGAVTSCIYENMVIQIVIFDLHNEHYDYNTMDIVLDENEPTSRFLSEILKKIGLYKNHHINQLHLVLEKNIQDEDIIQHNQQNIAPKSTEPEKSLIQGVENFSCTQDDFGLITIAGQYNNDNMKRKQIDLIVTFTDGDGNSIGKSSLTFQNLKEYEIKRFVGHTKWNENFHSCQISIQ